MAVAWRAVQRSGAKPTQSALIAGGGPIGLGVWFALRAQGVERILIAEPMPGRRKVLSALGAVAIDPVDDEVANAVAELTAGAGVDLAFDAAGAASAFASAIDNLTTGGRCVLVAGHQQPVDVDTNVVVMRELELIGSMAYLPADFDAVITAMQSGQYVLDGWVAQAPIESAVAAIRQLRSGDAMKLLITVE